MRSWLLLCGFCLVTTTAYADEAPPRSLDPRLKVTLFAEHPQIVTPTGIDVDPKGRVWAIESNTHFPPEGYTGHPTDRVLVMSDTDSDGRADRIIVFKDGIKQAMSVALRPVWFPAPASGGRQPPEAVPTDKAATSGKTPPPKPAPNNASAKKVDPKSDAGAPATLQGADAPRSPATSVYIATRRDIVLYHDDDGDDKADREELIVRLDSPGDYPHDGLAGFAFDALGWLHFGFGENLGAEYKVIGSDGTTLSGGGEGGSVYRCRLDGTKLERLATGFWNPHASCIDAFGRMFTVDNDPDSRPPCRLLHIIPGGDYGYRFRYGRKGLHPFSCWNGEIAGTLPMVAGTGEAPSGILAYESDGLPEEYIGNLLVTSWGDHRIDRFRLKEKGASFESLAEPVIIGGENFRPVGIACAPDGSLYFTDWMLRDYNVHGKGRVWRIEAVVGNRMLMEDGDDATPLQMLRSKSLARRRLAANGLKKTPDGRKTLRSFCRDLSNDERGRAEAALAYLPEVRHGADFFTIYEASDTDKSLNLTSGPAEIAHFRALYDSDIFDSAPGFSNLRQLAGMSAARTFGDQEPRAPIAWLQVDATRFNLAAVLNERESARSSDLSGLNLSLAKPDPFMFATFVGAMGRRSSMGELLSTLDNNLLQSAPARLALMLAGRIRAPKEAAFIKRGLSDESPIVRRLSVQWIAEEKLSDFRPQVEAILNDPKITADLFLATLAALEMLDGVPPAQFDMTPPGKYVLPLVKDEKRPAAVRALALRLVDPAEPALDDKLLGSLLASPEPALKLEVVRTLQQSPVVWSIEPLRKIAADNSADVKLRAEALAGLGRQTVDGLLPMDTRLVFSKVLKGNDVALQRETLRSLRGFVAKDEEAKKLLHVFSKGKGGVRELKSEVAFALDPSGGSRPPLAEVRAAVLEPTRDGDDPLAGRRGFYHANGAGCFKCHTVDGRGGKVGPDLSTIGRALSREKLLDSILDPSKEVAPQFVSWAMETADGKVHTGMLVHENEGKTVLGDPEGKLTELPTAAIVQRTAQKTSVMPEKLSDRMTVQEFRDLLAFLEGLR